MEDADCLRLLALPDQRLLRGKTPAGRQQPVEQRPVLRLETDVILDLLGERVGHPTMM